jgi:hypothetical protein
MPRLQVIGLDLLLALGLTIERYAAITVRMKEAAMKLCEPPIAGRDRGKAGWRDDAALLTWLASL